MHICQKIIIFQKFQRSFDITETSKTINIDIFKYLEISYERMFKDELTKWAFAFVKQKTTNLYSHPKESSIRQIRRKIRQ